MRALRSSGKAHNTYICTTNATTANTIAITIATTTTTTTTIRKADIAVSEGLFDGKRQ